MTDALWAVTRADERAPPRPLGLRALPGGTRRRKFAGAAAVVLLLRMEHAALGIRHMQKQLNL